VWPIVRSAGLWFDNGVRGLGIPPYTHFKRTPASINGSIWYGYIIPEREVFWPLWAEFTEEQDRAFWHTLVPYQTGTWTVQSPSGQRRSLDLRITDDGSWAPDLNPFLLGVVNYSLTFAAEQPLWRGETQYTSWQAPDPKAFRGGGPVDDPPGDQVGPPFHITASNTFNDAQIVNDGDVETWPLWVINGPCTTATLGIGTDTITVPFAVPDGKRLTINTDPTVQVALLGDPDPDDPVGLSGSVTEQTANLSSVTWSMIPPGGAVDVSISVTGAPSSVGIQYTPLYLRAW
jgi:hypothetical protein